MPIRPSKSIAKAALVTGGAQRIGAQIVRTLAKNGISVVVHYNSSAKKANDLAESIRQYGVSSWTIETDLSDQNDCARLVSRATALARRPISILVNNASIYPENSFSSMTFDDLVECVNINAFAPLVLMRSFSIQVPKSGGTIVNILDNRITDRDKNHAAYLLSKQMFATLTKTAAIEFAPHVRVNGIAPGLILPPKGKTTAFLKRLENTVPLGRHGSAQDIADAVMFSIASPFLTGDILYLDGGKHLYSR